MTRRAGSLWLVLAAACLAAAPVEAQQAEYEDAGFPIRLAGSWDSFHLVTPTIAGWRTRVNLVADYEFSHMDEHPTPSGGVIPTQDFFSQRHGNLILDAARGKLRWHGNLETYALTADGDGERFLKDTAQFGAMEYYGEYTLRDWLKFRFGKSLAPFGLFNEIRYLTPLYATVMLPFIYEPTGNVIPYEAFFPPHAHFMLSGSVFPADDVEWDYVVYLGGDERSNQKIISSFAFDEQPTWGMRSTATYREKISPGFSFYTTNVNRQGEGREWVYTWDLDLGPYRGFTTQAELAMGFRDKAPNRNSWNIRVSYDAGLLDPRLERFTPYVMFDRLDDRKDPLQRKKQNRYAGGMAARLTDNVTWKNEVHWHDYSDLDDGPVVVEKKGRRTWMYRSSLILAF